MKKIKFVFLIMLAVLLFIPILAKADFINVGFQRITDNGNGVNPEGQFYLTIYNPTQDTWGKADAGQLMFVFQNAVGFLSNISDIYFDDHNDILSSSYIYNSLVGTTNFVAVPIPLIFGNLPGGGTVNPPFVATDMFSADIVTDPENGINETADTLGIVYNVSSGLTGVDSAIKDGSLRIGLNVQSIGTKGLSDSFINTPIPEPGTLLLLGFGLVGLAGYARIKLGRKAK